MANTLKFGNGEWYGKKDTILAYNDENDNYKPLLFDFSRNSSATVINKDGLIETVSSGQPRIDYKDDTKGALLLEPQRSNAIRYSSDFSQWTLKSNVTINSNVGLAPDGTLSADRVVFNGTTNARVEDTAQGIDAFSYTNDRPISVWLKSESGTTTVQFGSSSSYLLTVTVTEEWQRFTYISKQGFARIKSDNATSVLAWGYQFETNGDVSLSYATSYIPTSGSAVTRVADVCFGAGNEQVINSTEGVLYAEFEISDLSTSLAYPIAIYGTGSTIQIYYRPASQSITFLSSFGGIQYLYHSNINVLGVHKVALSYKNNQYTSFADGVLLNRQNSGNVPTPNTLNTLSLKDSGVSNFNGKVKEVKLYNTVLTDQELIELTTIQE